MRALIWTAVAVTMLVVTGWWWSKDSKEAEAPPPTVEAVRASAPASVVSAASTGDGAANESIAAAETAASRPMPTRGEPAAKWASDSDRSHRLEALQKRIQGVLRSGKADAKQAIDLIDELQQIHGSSVVGGVDLSVLRHNLSISQQMMQVMNEVKELTSEPGKAEANASLIEAKMRRLKELQGQVRKDVALMPSLPPSKEGIRQ